MTFFLLWSIKDIKGSWTEKSKFFDLFTYKRSLYHKNISFQNSKLSSRSKNSLYWSSLPKWELVECATLWCNSVAKLRLLRWWSTPASTSLSVKPHPPIHACSVYERGEYAGLRKNQMIKMSLKATRRCPVPSCGKAVFAFFYLLWGLNNNKMFHFWEN